MPNFTLADYEVVNDEQTNKPTSVKRSDMAYIPYGSWGNKDWQEYAKLANLQEG